MSFAEELSNLLPADLPNRDLCVEKATAHLEMIVAINEVMNLTRIVSPREAAIKHVLDSVLPWRLFAGAGHVADAGTGPGFPGIPLAIVLPGVKFTLLEATQKKARFVESVVEKLGLDNARVAPVRAEEWLYKNRPDIVTARAMAPLHKAIGLFTPAFKSGTRVLLYKGPDVDTEIAEAEPEARRRRVKCTVIQRYELPDGMGARTVVELARA